MPARVVEVSLGVYEVQERANVSAPWLVVGSFSTEKAAIDGALIYVRHRANEAAFKPRVVWREGDGRVALAVAGTSSPDR